jgi:hypothetical protein
MQEMQLFATKKKRLMKQNQSGNKAYRFNITMVHMMLISKHMIPILVSLTLKHWR